MNLPAFRFPGTTPCRIVKQRSNLAYLSDFVFVFSPSSASNNLYCMLSRQYCPFHSPPSPASLPLPPWRRPSFGRGSTFGPHPSDDDDDDQPESRERNSVLELDGRWEGMLRANKRQRAELRARVDCVGCSVSIVRRKEQQKGKAAVLDHR